MNPENPLVSPATQYATIVRGKSRKTLLRKFLTAKHAKYAKARPEQEISIPWEHRGLAGDVLPHLLRNQNS